MNSDEQNLPKLFNLSLRVRPIATLILGGNIDSNEDVRLLTSNSDLVVCADGGANYARNHGIFPNAIVGDLDSAKAETLEYFEKHNTEIILVADQEKNDFQKALDFVIERFNSLFSSKDELDIGSIAVFGMTGGRLDHTLANLSVMLLNADRFQNIVALGAGQEHRFLTQKRSNCQINCEIGTIISLTPFGEADQVVTENLQFPLKQEALRLGFREGISNVATASPVSISISGGALLVSVTTGSLHAASERHE